MHALYYLKSGDGFERQIHQNNIGMMSGLECGQRFFPITGLGKHLHIGLEIDEHRHAMPHHGVVIHQHHLCFRGSHSYPS